MPPQFKEVPAVAAFRRLPWLPKWIVGMVILALCYWAVVAQLAHVPEPGEPRRALFFTLLAFVALTVLNELMRPKPSIEDARPKGLGDFSFPTATEGRVVPLIWGLELLTGSNVIWYGDLKQEAITEKVKTGLWSSDRITKGFRYHVGVQFALCRGPGVVLKRVLIGDTEVFSGTVAGGARFDIDKIDLYGGDDLGSGGLQATCDFEGGTTTQAVNAYLDDPSRQQVVQPTVADTAPRYTGLSYVVAREFTSAAPLTTNAGAYVGNSTTVRPWKFEVQRFPGLFSGQTAGENIIGTDDCNPMNVIYEILTNDEWGFGFPDADIDVGAGSTFVKASDRLIAEVNGFGMVLDRAMKASDLMQEVQRQIDGVVFLNQRTGKWTVQLVRGPDDPEFGYDIDTVPQFTDGVVQTVRNFTRGSWEDTTNQIAVRFNKRADDYKLSYALAQDMANAQIQGGGTVLTATTVSAEVSYPGVKTSALAINLAWRDLRAQSFPLARATFVVDRSFWDLIIGEVVAWTNTKLGLVKLPMRITRIDFGKLEDNKMTVTAVQDVFEFAAASYGAPPTTGWNPPTTSLVAFPAAEQFAAECPRAILVRDPSFGGDDTISKVFTAARQQGTEVSFKIKQRNASGAPSGSFSDAGDVLAFMRIGELTSSLAAGTAVPTATITVTPTPDSQTAIESIFDDASTVQDLGVDLVQLILVGTEFMLVQKAAVNGGNVDLQNVYRGVLDSAQQAHAASTDVFLLFVGGGLTDTLFPDTNNVDIELRMRSSSAQFAGSVTTISLVMAKRAKRPYLPSEVSIDGTRYSAAVSLEGSGSGLDGFRNDYTWLRRDFQAADEVVALTDDGGSGLLANTEYQVELRADPDTADNLIGTGAFVTSSSPAIQFLRKLILHYSPSGVAGAEIRCIIRSQHDHASETDIGSRQTLIYDYTPTSALTSQFALGSLAATTISAVFTTAATGTFTLTIGTAFSTSDVEARVNGGSFSVIIAATGTTGTIVGITSGDTIECRHTVNDSGARTFLEIKDPSSVARAYGILHAGQAAS